MNKKILFLILLAVLFVPFAVNAQATSMIIMIQRAATTIGAALVVVGWIIAGVLYLTSAGSPEKTGTAKKALIAAVIGTVLVLIAGSAGLIINSLLTSGT